MKHFNVKNVIYEDNVSVAFLPDNPIAPAHTTIIPKLEFPILEQVPDDIISHLFDVANTISKLLFDKLNIQGTNILLNNGIPAGQTVPHVSIHVIPRTENDGIEFQWEMSKANPEDLSTNALLITDSLNKLSEKKVVIKETPTEEVSEDMSDWISNNLRRTP